MPFEPSGVPDTGPRNVRDILRFRAWARIGYRIDAVGHHFGIEIERAFSLHQGWRMHEHLSNLEQKAHLVSPDSLFPGRKGISVVRMITVTSALIRSSAFAKSGLQM